MDGYQALLLVSFGGPEKAEDVTNFLERVTAGRNIPMARAQAVAEHYYANGGASPLNQQCRLLLANLQEVLGDLGLSLYWGNRNWHPLLEGTVAEMRDAGVERALALVTSAYGGYSSCRQYLEDIASARERAGPGAPVIDKLRLYYNHPGWVEPWALSLRQALGTVGDSNPLVIFTAHSIPEAMASASPYIHHVTSSARLVAAAAGAAQWQLAWQSRSGSPGQPWLGPDVNEVLAATTASSVVLAPIGFVLDNMEIVHDLDVEATGTAQRRGLHMVRAGTIGTTAAFAQMARQLVEERLGPRALSPGPAPAPAAPALALGPDGPWPPVCPAGHCPSPAQLLASRL